MIFFLILIAREEIFHEYFFTDPILQPKNSEVLIRTQSLEDLQMKMKTLLENQQEKVASIMENR